MKKSNGAIYIVIAAFCWGLFPTFSRIAYKGGISVLTLTMYRATLTAVVYIIWGLIKGIFKGLKLKDYLFFMFYGIAAVLSTFLFYALAIKELSAPMAAILLYTAPAFVILFSRLFYKTPITKTKLFALTLTFVGSFFVVKAYDFSSLKANFIGVVFGLLSGISYSMLTIIGKKGLKKHSPLVNSFLPTIASALILCLLVPPWTVTINSSFLWLIILCVAIFGGVLPYYFYIKGLGMGIDGGNASLLANIEPLTATICGVIFFSDSLNILQLFGIAVTLYGAILPQFLEEKC